MIDDKSSGEILEYNNKKGKKPKILFTVNDGFFEPFAGIAESNELGIWERERELGQRDAFAVQYFTHA